MSIFIIILISIFCHQCECTNGSNHKSIIDRCSNFSGFSPNTSLVECPPAKFMTKDEFECYDKTYKDSYNSEDMYFWCWSRKDYPEYFLKKTLNISTSYRYEEYNTSFTSSFQFNETNGVPTSVKCNDEWAQTWYDVSYAQPIIPCNTSTLPMIADFQWQTRNKL